MLLALNQLLFCFLNIVLAFSNVGLNTVYFLALSKDQSWQLIEENHALIYWSFKTLNISKLVLDVANSVFDLNTGLSIDLFLEHSVGSVWIVYIPFNLLFSQISVNKLDLSGDFILDSVFVLFLEFLLFEEHFANLFTEVEIKISFHAGFWFILNINYTTGWFFLLSLTDFSIYKSFSLIFFW